jgi:opacity protein-like surface antigen
MKKIILVFATVFVTVSGFAQKTADIGIWGGTSTYLGDMDEVTPFQSFKPNFGAYFRYNFNARVGMRAMFLTGNSAADGVIGQTPWDFSKSVQDFSLMAEINYLRFIPGLKNTRFSPYILGGIGVSFFPYVFPDGKGMEFMMNNPDHPLIVNNGAIPDINNRETTFSLPFGFGVKYNLGERLGIGVEYQMRKLFSDKLDNLDDPLAYINDAGEEIIYNSTIHNNDWTGYLGVHLTYMIYIGKDACPAYDSKYW